MACMWPNSSHTHVRNAGMAVSCVDMQWVGALCRLQQNVACVDRLDCYHCIACVLLFNARTAIARGNLLRSVRPVNVGEHAQEQGLHMCLQLPQRVYMLRG